MKNTRKVVNVDEKEQRPEDRALRNSGEDFGRSRLRAIKVARSSLGGG